MPESDAGSVDTCLAERSLNKSTAGGVFCCSIDYSHGISRSAVIKVTETEKARFTEECRLGCKRQILSLHAPAIAAHPSLAFALVTRRDLALQEQSISKKQSALPLLQARIMNKQRNGNAEFKKANDPVTRRSVISYIPTNS